VIIIRNSYIKMSLISNFCTWKRKILANSLLNCTVYFILRISTGTNNHILHLWCISNILDTRWSCTFFVNSKSIKYSVLHLHTITDVSNLSKYLLISIRYPPNMGIVWPQTLDRYVWKKRFFSSRCYGA